MKNLKDPFRLMATDLLRADLRDLWTKTGGVLSRNVFGQIQVLLRHLGSVCAQFRKHCADGA